MMRGFGVLALAVFGMTGTALIGAAAMSGARPAVVTTPTSVPLHDDVDHRSRP